MRWPQGGGGRGEGAVTHSSPPTALCPSQKVHLPFDERDKPARVGVIDDHGMDVSLITLAGAIYKHKNSRRFCQTLMHITILVLTLLEGPAAPVQMYI